MQIGPQTRNLFQRLEARANNSEAGITFAELNSLDSDGNGQLNQAESGINDANELNQLNQTLSQARAKINRADMQPTEVLFAMPARNEAAPAPQPQVGSPFARQLVDEMSREAFNPAQPDLPLRLKTLESTLLSGKQQGINPYTLVTPDGISGVDLSQLDGAQNFEGLNSQTRATLAAQLGLQANDPALDSYLNQNFDRLAAQLGSDLSDRYNGKVKMIGEAEGLTAFQQSESNIVCTDIHASIAAFRQSVGGQEAYIVSTSANDAAHVFTVFKDNASGTWNIQNYDKVIRTDAKNLRELYDKYMPDQRKIRLFSVGSDGSISQERNALTSTGLREWKFRNLPGAGNFDPNNAREGLTVGTNTIGATYGKFNFNFNPQSNTLALNLYDRQQNADGSTVLRGGALEGQSLTTPGNFSVQRLDGKYEEQKTWSGRREPAHVSREQLYWNVHAGVEQESGQPIYWNDTSDGSTPVGSGNIATRVGANFSYSSQHLLGSSALKFEVGHRQAAGATVTLNASGEGADVIESYATRMWNDLTLESSANLGLNYQQGGLSVRSGLTPKLDLAKVDGFTDFGKELRNVFELDAYSELSYRQPRGWSVGLMGTASLTHPGVVQVGAFSQYQFNPQLALATTISADLDPILGNRAGINTGVQYQPLDWLKLNAHAGIGIDQQPMVGLNITGLLPRR